MSESTTAKLFARDFARVGEMVSQPSSEGPYRTITEIERFREVWRIWLEPNPDDPDAPEYIDATVNTNLWMPHDPDAIQEPGRR